MQPYTDWLINCNLIATALRATKLLEVYLEEKPLKAQLLHELCRPHELLFLDEPSNDLDLETLDWLQQMIQTSPQTILFISHHEDFFDSDGGYDHPPKTDPNTARRLKPL